MIRRFFQLITGRSNQALSDTRKPVSAVDEANFAELNKFSPIKVVGGSQRPVEENSEGFLQESSVKPSIVCREAVLDKNQKVIGYSFTLTRGVNEYVRKSSELVRHLYDDVLLGSVFRMDIQRLLGHRLAFIPILPSSLTRAPIEKLPREGVVLVLTSLTELTHNSSEYLTRLIALKHSGFRFGLQGDVTLPDLQPFLDLAEFVFIDVGCHDLPTIKTQIDAVSQQVMSKNFVAINVKLLEEFHVCSKLPFSYFQGAFVTSREAWDTPVMDAGRIKILNLLNLLRQEVANVELVQMFKQDPALSFKVLRYINSAGFGLATKINSIDQALLMLGRQSLYRWLTLLLFTSGNSNALDLALLENALVRARFAEICAGESLSASERDELFIAGIFSLLDVLLHTPMEKVLEQVNLPPLVVEALLHKRGKYAPYLELVIACEAFDQDLIVNLSSQIGLNLTQVTIYQTDALIWAGMANQ